MDVVAQALDWMRQDPDHETRHELKALIEARDVAALETLFAGTLEFGTAGLRGELGAGPMRMNRVTVARAAAGLCRWLLLRPSEAEHAPRLVIGYDARHKSDEFARDTAEIAQGTGVEALLLPAAVPTPLLAFAIGFTGADAGVMVTASHNPPRDNGYKVYLGDSAQITSPVDAEIAAEIAAVGNIDELDRSLDYTLLDTKVSDAYVDAAVALLDADGARDLSVVHTAMHGVGTDTFLRASTAAGFFDVFSVPEQERPDPDFPTVAFPNPEEPGAMDLALRLAEFKACDLVIANDPDADRCAVAVRMGDADGASYRMLTGDQVGVLLADAMLGDGVEGTYACSIVSSSMLGKLAAAHNQPSTQTLTGFKWIGRAPNLAFGYEEALGYCSSPHMALDKDGITAGLRIMALAAALKEDGRTLWDRLEELYGQFGWHATGQVSVRKADRAELIDVIRMFCDGDIDELAGRAVESFDDLSEGVDGLPPTPGLRFFLSGGTRVVVRPSGTEPKLKCYLEVVADSQEAAEAELSDVSDKLSAWLTA